jgi:isoleucyl-tRNA synthetase
MSSRRLEPEFGHNQRAFADYCTSAVNSAVSAMGNYGVVMSKATALRDDNAMIRAHITATIADLADAGAIRFLSAEEKWCLDCQLALPPSSSAQVCFTCGNQLIRHTTQDWFLVVSIEEIIRRAAAMQWIPRYGLRRLQSLTDIHPLIRVGHPHRTLGVPSPLRDGDVLDPRLVGALGPSVLRRLGLDGPIIAVAGFDIQRKWLMTLLAANNLDALPFAIVHHGTLLDVAGRKLSRYSGASLADAPTDAEPCLVRAALLSAPLGKDLRAAELPTIGASRLREKVLNSLRFIGLQQRADAGGIDLDAESETALAHVDSHLKSCDMSRAYASFQRAITHDLSGVLIPKIRKHGLSEHSATWKRITSLHRVFYGDDPRLVEICDRYGLRHSRR